MSNIISNKVKVVLFLIALVAVSSLIYRSVILSKNKNSVQISDERSKFGSLNESLANDVDLEVATDPSFVELKGKLLPEFPEFPVYPGSKLVASSTVNPPELELQGVRAKWTTSDSVKQSMQWYLTQLENNSWKINFTDDPESEGEQIAYISNDRFEGYIATEVEDDATEIVADLRIK